jgi:lipoate-protein ligase A
MKLAQVQGEGAANKAEIVKKNPVFSIPGFDITTIFEFLGFDKHGFLEAIKSGRTLSSLAADKNMSRQQLIAIISEGIDKNYDQEVHNGKISQEDANALKAKTRGGIDKLIDTPLTQFNEKKNTVSIDIKPALDLLGIDKQSFANASVAGQSLVDMATEKGVTRQQLIDSLLTQFNQTLDDALRSGNLTNEDGDNKKQSVLKQINKMIDYKGNGLKKNKVLQK